eukprot:11954585-Heterocapsa_arctica.AAC.1
MLAQHALKENDQYYFYCAASSAFIMTAAGCLVVWVLWALKAEPRPDMHKAKTLAERDEVFILWVSPLVVAISNLVFGLVVGIRVYLS